MKYLKIQQIIRRNLNIIVMLSLIIMVSTAFNIYSPFVLEDAISSEENIIGGLALYFLVLICSAACSLLYQWLKKVYAIKFKEIESIRLSKLIYRMKYQDILQKEPTYLIERVEDAVENMYTLISEGVSEIVTGILSIIILIIIIQKYSKFLMGLYIVYTLCSFFGFKFLNKTLLDKSIRMQDIVADNFKNILSFMINVDFMKNLSKFSYISKYLARFYKSSAKENADVNFFAESVSTILILLLNMVQSSIYVYIFYLSFIKSISFSEAAVLILLNNIYKEAMDTVIHMNINLRDVRASMEFINTAIIPNQEKIEGEVKLTEVSSVEVEIKNISYGETKLINNGEFRCEKGDVVGLVGESGKGKSTFIKNMIGLMVNDENKILYNNVEINNIDKDSLRHEVMYVSQNPSIFPITLKENCMLCVDDENREEASKELDKIINYKGFSKFKDLENGLDTVILEGGSNLSGGDKQKISVIRVLLGGCDLLILDEFSNSIDKETQEFIVDLVKEKYKDKILILITHDETLLKSCNKVYKIEDRCLSRVKEGEI